jgi:hypothetical protein
MGRPTRPEPKRKRWGLRTLAFLTLAFASIMASNALSATGRGSPALAYFGVLVGLVGAGYCSYRGLRDSSWMSGP